jgi:serine/threonine-protein kinase
MSRVFVAEETALDRKVVIKVLPPETAAHVSVARFKREILLAAKLQHPHIVPLLTAGESNGLPYDFCSRTHSLLPFGPTPASRPSLSG